MEQDVAGFSLPVFVPRIPHCPQREEDEIVVCAEDPEKFRLRPLPETFPDHDHLPRARIKLGEDASIGAEAESAGVGGHPSRRMMVRGRIKF